MILYSMIEGRKLRLLEGDFDEPIQRAWAALSTQVNNMGQAIGVSAGTGPGDRANYLARPQGTYTWGTGAMLMAATPGPKASVWKSHVERRSLAHGTTDESRRTVPRGDELPAGRSSAALGMGHVVGQTIARWTAEGLPADLKQRSSTSPNTSASTPTSSSGSPRPIRPSTPCNTTSKGSSRTWTITCGSAAGSFPITAGRSSRCAPGPRVRPQGEAVVWITLEGYFWFPRTLMGFTKISLAFYDQPELIHRINQDLTDFNLRILDAGGEGVPARRSPRSPKTCRTTTGR